MTAPINAGFKVTALREYQTRAGMDAARIVARERFAWPGGYELVLITSDGGCLCSACVRENYRSVYDSHKTKTDDGWRPGGLMILEGGREDYDGLTCDNCNRDFFEGDD